MAFRGVAALACAAAVGWGLAAGALANDFERGRLLYGNHCQQCHDSRAHVRDKRKAYSLAAIRHQVDRWQGVLGLRWDAEEIADVVQYLNLRYYHYHMPPWTALEPPATGDLADGPS